MRLRQELFGLVVPALAAPACLAADGLTLPKDLVLPANVAAAIYRTRRAKIGNWLPQRITWFSTPPALRC